MSAPAVEPGGTTPQAPAGPAAGVTDDQASALLADAVAAAERANAADSTSPWDDPAAAKAEIERLRKENGAARTNAKAQAAEEARASLAQEIGKALGIIKGDEPADPAKLTEQLTAAGQEARQAKLELAVFRAAQASEADPAALLDSRAFLAKIANADPTDSDAITAAIAEAVAANPRLGKPVTTPGRPKPDPSQASGANGRSVASPAAEFASIIQGLSARG